MKENIQRKEHVSIRKDELENLERFVKEKKKRVETLRKKLRDLENTESERLTATHKTKAYIRSKANIRKEIEAERRKLRENFANEEEDVQVSHDEALSSLRKDIKTRRVLCERHIKEIHDIRNILEDVLLNMSTAQLDFIRVLHEFRKKKRRREEEKEVPELEKLFDQLQLVKENEKLKELSAEVIEENKIVKQLLIELLKENQKLKAKNKLFEKNN